MNLIEDLKLQSEGILYSTVADYDASKWHDINRQLRDPVFIKETVTDQYNQLCRLMSSVSKADELKPFNGIRLETLEKMINLVKPSMQKISRGELPTSATLITHSVILNIGTGDLGECLVYLRRIRNNEMKMVHIAGENKKLLGIFEDKQLYGQYIKRFGCSVSRPQIACAYLEMVQPIFVEGNGYEALYAGHHEAFGKRFLNESESMIRKIDSDLRKFNPNQREYYQSMSYWGILTKQIEPSLQKIRSQRQRALHREMYS